MKTAAIVALLATGCSFVGVRGGPPVSEHGGCTDGYPLPVADLVVTGLAMSVLAGLAIGLDRCESREGEHLFCFAYGLGMVPPGVMLFPYLVSAGYGFIKVSTCRAAKQARADAWALTKTAAAAARVGDCNTVRKIDLEVVVLDAEFRATVFLADVGINRCMGSDDDAPPPDPPALRRDGNPQKPAIHQDSSGASARLAARNRASTLKENARVAARAGDCETVRNIDPEVLALDAGFHRNTFLADVGIRRCLEPAITAPPTTPAPAPPTAPVQP